MDSPQNMSTEFFLDLIWGDRESYVDVPAKAGGYWVPWIGEWPQDREMIHRRIDQCSDDGENVYFSCAQFRTKGRRIADVLPTHWLWADLDLVDPLYLDQVGVLPTLAWSSSPGRYQAMWRLDREMKPESQTKLNRALSHAVGADKGGWDLTQVLRPIDTFNWNYEPYGEVELEWYDETRVYTRAEIIEAIRAVRRGKPITQQIFAPKLRIPPRARMLLRATPGMVVEGERSTQLFRLEMILAEAGFTEDQMFEVLWPCAWNKWREMSTGETRLRADIKKALAKATEERPRSTTPRTRGSKDTRPPVEADPDKVPARRPKDSWHEYATFLSQEIETPHWLIENIWSSSAHGIIGGEPKTSKSTFTLAMALSVATGRPFLGIPEFRVPNPGPVLLIQEENAPWVVQDRLRKLAHMYGLLGEVETTEAPEGSIAEEIVRIKFPEDAPLYMLNNYGFNLQNEEHTAMLEDKIAETEAQLVIIDPLYLVSGGVNLNQQHEVTPLLTGLMQLRHRFDVAVAIVHHWAKISEFSAQRRSGQRLMGTSFFHGWLESGLYMENLGAEDGVLTVKVEREFRNVAPQDDLEIEWYLGEPGALDLTVKSLTWDPDTEIELILKRLFSNGDWKRGLNAKYVTKEMGLGMTDAVAKQNVYLKAKELGYTGKRKSYRNGDALLIFDRNGDGS